MSYNEIQSKLQELSNPQHASILQRFFKTGKGQYGEGDVFLGIRNPSLHLLARNYAKTDLKIIQKMLFSKYHEERMLSLLILVKKFAKADEPGQKEIFDFYTNNTQQINNWDLVDLSAPHVVGSFLIERERELLFSFSTSDSLWKRRISMISTLTFIRLRDYDTTFALAEILLNDKQDLIQKAVGWMLREIGKRDIDAELMFLNAHYKKMPRTMLRYAIEKFPEPLRLSYLKGEA